MSFFKDYFTYSKKERSGILALFILMLLSIFSYFILDFINFSQPNYDYSKYKKEIDEFEKGQEITKKDKIAYQKSSNKKLNNQVLFQFNPNTISQDSLLLLGVYPNISQRIVKYRDAGGLFKSPNDLMKIYGFNEKLYKRLEPFIIIPESKTNTEVSYDERIDKKTLINLNTADTNQLKSLTGIGSKLSNRIIQYRNKLGGFHSKDQLGEIYGLKEEVILSIQNQITVDQTYLKININQVSAAELKNHPYIKTWNQANAIVNYREKHGNYSTVNDLLKTDLVDADLCRKIAPYLVFE